MSENFTGLLSEEGEPAWLVCSASRPRPSPFACLPSLAPTTTERHASHRRRPPLLPSALDQAAAHKRARASLQYSAARSRKHWPPLSFFSRHTPRPGHPSPSPRAPSPGYKRPPLLNGKMQLTSLSLLDIVSHSVASWFELAGARRAPGRPAVSGVPEHPSSRRLDEVDEEKPRHRYASSPPPSLPLCWARDRADLPIGEPCVLSRVGEDVRTDLIFVFVFLSASVDSVPLARPGCSLPLGPVNLRLFFSLLCSSWN
jgi:hypothetical protein